MSKPTNAEVIAEIASRAGYGDNDESTYQTKTLRAYNKAIRKIIEQKFLFLRTLYRTQTSENKIDYYLENLLIFDGIQISANPTRKSSSTTLWTTDNSTNKTGHVDVAFASGVAAGSIIQIGDNEFEIDAYTDYGTASEDITLNYTPPTTGTEVHYVSEEDEQKDMKVLLPCSIDTITLANAAKNTRGLPKNFNISGNTNYSGSSYGHKLYVGNPTPDDTYLLEYWGWPWMEVTSSDTALTNVIVSMYSHEVLVDWGTYYYFLDLKDVEMAAAWSAEAQKRLGVMQSLFPVARKPGF